MKKQQPGIFSKGAQWGAIAQELILTGFDVPAVTTTTQDAETQSAPVSASAIDSILYDTATLTSEPAEKAKRKTCADIIDESEELTAHDATGDNHAITWDFA